jgi:hypothetical protein
VNVIVYNPARTGTTMHTSTSPIDEPATYRLETPLDELVLAPVVARKRQLHFALTVGGAIALVAGIVFLAITLPANDVALGFDVLLVASIATTAVLVFFRRQLVPLSAFATGVLLICDAWFDVVTAGPRDLWASALTATLVELPVAVILIATALRMLWLNREAVVAGRYRDATVAGASAPAAHAYA